MNINEIAKLAGVSRTTVSRYLNDGYVSDQRMILKEINQNREQCLRVRKSYNFIW